MSEKITSEMRYRAEVGCETELITKRLTWTLTFQGFMFAAFGLLKSAETPDTAALRGICVLGLVAAASSFFSTLAALARISELRKEWEKDLKLVNVKPTPFSNPVIHFLGHNSSIVIPALAAIWWAVAMCSL